MITLSGPILLAWTLFVTLGASCGIGWMVWEWIEWRRKKK